MKKMLLIILACLAALIQAHEYRVYLQPFQGTRLFAGETELAYRVVERDNSSAFVSFSHTDTQIILRASHDGYADSQVAALAGTLRFVILDKPDAPFVFENAFPTGTQPKSVTFIDNVRVIVPLLAGNGAEVINVVSGERHLLPLPGRYPRQQGFVEALILAHRNEIWISQMFTASIHIYDLQTLDYKRTINTTGNLSKVLAYNPVLDRVFFTHWLSEDVSIINPSTYQEEQRVRYGAVPRGLTFSSDGAYMYLAQYELAGRSVCQVLKINLATLAVEARLGALGAKRHIVKDEERQLMFVSDMARNTVEVYNMTTDSLVRTIRVYDKPNTIVLSPDRRYPTLDYLHKGLVMGQVHMIDTRNFETVAVWEGGNQPTGLDISPNGQRMVFSDFLDHRIRVYRRVEAEQAALNYWLAGTASGHSED